MGAEPRAPRSARRVLARPQRAASADVARLAPGQGGGERRSAGAADLTRGPRRRRAAAHGQLPGQAGPAARRPRARGPGPAGEAGPQPARPRRRARAPGAPRPAGLPRLLLPCSPTHQATLLQGLWDFIESVRNYAPKTLPDPASPVLGAGCASHRVLEWVSQESCALRAQFQDGV